MTMEAPFAPKSGFCPKCISAKTAESTECARCGLRFSLWKGEAEEWPSWLREGWVGLWDDWQNAALHAALWADAQMAQELTLLARLYRIALTYKPEDEWALRGLSEVTQMAVRGLQASEAGSLRPETAEVFKKRLTVAVAVFLIALAGYALVQWVLPR